MKMRVTLITLGTTLSTVAVIANAFYQKKQFYPSIVYLTKSNPSVAVLYAQVFVLVLLFGKVIRKIFFGQLRAAEVEHLIEKFWYVITETCLAFTVFRDDFSPKFVALFTFLLFTKAFHWLIEDRVDYMERSPVITKLFHFRVASLLMILGTIDAVLIHHALKITISSGASVQMVFGFEYAILLVMVVAILMKYILHSIDYLSEHPWENKNVYLLYAELVTGFIKCLLYILFVGIMVKIHTFPLFAIRPMYLTIRGFKKSLSDVILSRRAITYMNTRFPDATEEELQQQDNTCIICREAMTSGKKLPCNHIFHAHCLRSWFQRQQSCPTCRLDVLSQAANTPPTPAPAQQPPVASHPNIPPPQGPAPLPGFVNMPIPPMPMGMPPMPPMPPAASEGVQAPGPSDGGNLNIPSSGPTGNPFLTGMPPPPPFFMGTPPPFLGSPFMPPPLFAMPPNMDMSALSVEQLQQMEGQERENIEARIKVLKNVHSLLDMAIVQLNQYSQVITALNNISFGQTQPDTQTGGETQNSAETQNQTETENLAETQSHTETQSQTESQNQVQPEAQTQTRTRTTSSTHNAAQPPTATLQAETSSAPSSVHKLSNAGNALPQNFANTAPTQSASYQTSSKIPCSSTTCDSKSNAIDGVTRRSSDVKEDDVTRTVLVEDDVSFPQEGVEDLVAEEIVITTAGVNTSNECEENELRRRRLMKFANPRKEEGEGSSDDGNDDSANQG